MKKLPIWLLVIILIGVYWQWFIPGSKVATDYPVISSSALKPFINFPQLWSEYGAEGLGEYTVFTLWSWPFVFISGLLAELGISFQLRERILIMIPFLILGIWGMWKFGEDIKLSKSAKFIATLFYLTNSYILLVLDGGQLTIGLAYTFLPISFLAIKNAIYAGFKKKILAGLSVWIIGFFDFRFISLLILLCLIYFLYELLFIGGKWKNWIAGWFKMNLILGFIVITLNAFWLIPIIKVPLSTETITKLTQTDFISFINLGHSILMLSPHWFKNVFGVLTPLRFEFIFIALFAFLAPILRPKDKAIGFWLVVAIVSIFLTKGTADPFGEVYRWLYFNIPGFSLFRDSTKFFSLVALSYAVLIGITTDEILQIIRKTKGFSNFRLIFLIIITFYLLLIIWPSWSNFMTGTLSSQPLEKEYSKLNQLLESDKKFSRIFWIPSIPPLGQIDSNHPSVEAARLVQKRIFAQGILGTYEIFNFLREAPYMGEIFDVASIGYIAYPYLDSRRDDIHLDNIRYHSIFSDQLSKLPWLSKVEYSPVPLFKVNNHQNRFFIASNIWWVIGSDKIYEESTKSAQLKLSQNALVFAEERTGLGSRIDELTNAKIVLSNKTLLDLAASFISPENLIFPAKQLSNDPNQSGWWKRQSSDLVWWRDFLKTKYGIDNKDFDLGGGWAIGEGNIKYQISNIKYQKESVLLARVLESTRSGQLRFYHDNELIGEIDTNKEGNNIRWFEVGELVENGIELTIESSGNINVVNALAILSDEEWLSYKNKADDFERKNLISDFKAKIKSSYPEIHFEMISPTKYKISAKNITGQSMLVFSSNYDSSWRLDNKHPFPLYSLLNGFLIEKDGDYELTFKPQQYTEAGFYLFSVSLITLVLVVIFSNKIRR